MPRDDGAPELDELTRAIQWAADHAVYASDDARRPDVLAWLLSHLPSLIAAQGQGLRDDGVPSVAALRIALTDAQTAFSGEDDRHAALGWLLAHLSSLIADSADLIAIREKCRVVYYPPLSDPTGTYPIEHTMAARKDSWDTIIYALRASAPPHTGASDE